MVKRFRMLGLAVVVLGGLAVLGGCRSADDALLDAPKSLPKGETTEVKLFYPNGTEIVAESHVIEKKANMPKAALDELFKLTPTNKQIKPVLPAAKVLDVKVKNGKATVDLDRSVLKFKGSKREQLMAAMAVVKTVGEFKEIKTVRFLIEGKSKGTIGGEKIDLFWGGVPLKNDWKL